MADGDTLADVFARLRLGGCQVTVSGCAADSSDRHNVGRIPAIDYFARKLAKGSSEEHWRGLTFGKAGEAAALPDVHASPEAYLTDMQAHTALEFQARSSHRMACLAIDQSAMQQAWQQRPPRTPVPAGCRRRGAGIGRGAPPRARAAVVELWLGV